MRKIIIHPTLIYFLICVFAWTVTLLTKGLAAFLGILLLGLSTFPLIVGFEILHEIPDPFLGFTSQWGPVLSTNQELLLYQAFSLLIIFSISNDYQTEKNDKITLIRRSVPFFFIGGFLLYSGFVTYVLHADKHVRDAKYDVELVMAKVKKIDEHFKQTGKHLTNKELNCTTKPCEKSFVGPYWEIFSQSNNEYKLEARKVRSRGHRAPFYSSASYIISYDSKTKKTNQDHLTNAGWWILCFIPRAIVLLVIMVLPFTINLAKSRIRCFGFKNSLKS